jgi:hypothetical protein
MPGADVSVVPKSAYAAAHMCVVACAVYCAVDAAVFGARRAPLEPLP